MASKSQIQANRKNAARSTGPKTEQGKAASARNASKHGLSSAGIVILPTEDPADLDALAASLTSEHNPQGDTETFLVHQMVAARWKLARLERFEGQAYEDLFEQSFGPADPDRRALTALGRTGSIFDKLQRYSAAAERSYYRALRELQNLRSRQDKVKKQNEASDAQAVLQGLLDDPTLCTNPTRFRPPYDDVLQNEPNFPVATSEDDVLRR